MLQGIGLNGKLYLCKKGRKQSSYKAYTTLSQKRKNNWKFIISTILLYWLTFLHILDNSPTSTPAVIKISDHLRKMNLIHFFRKHSELRRFVLIYCLKLVMLQMTQLSEEDFHLPQIESADSIKSMSIEKCITELYRKSNMISRTRVLQLYKKLYLNVPESMTV